ncbi:beta-ketoacyl-ACP synthase II [Angustibacter aerolatus]
MAPTKRIVVTGLGATTPIGGDVPSTWQAALDGVSGGRTLTQDWVAQHELPVTFGAPALVPAADVLPKVEIRRQDPSAQFALIAAREAWADAGTPDTPPERLGVVLATGIGGIWTLLDQWDNLREKGPRRVFPLTVPMLMPNSSAAAISIELGARAGTHTPVSACASGAEAIAYAAQMIRDGRADVVVAGGTEAAIHPVCLAAFAAMQALSTRNDDPAAASRPYDANRDGFVLGEGAGVVVLESEEHARARGAKIYAEVAGAGMSNDAYHIAAPDPVGAGAARAMRAALAEADASVDDVVHVNAHSTSTPVGDVAEASSIHAALGEAAAQRAVVSATKSMTGHMLGAAGAVEAIFTVLAVQHRLAPPTINVDQLDPEIHLDVAIDKPRDLPPGDVLALNNSFGFGGANVALAIRSI